MKTLLFLAGLFGFFAVLGRRSSAAVTLPAVNPSPLPSPLPPGDRPPENPNPPTVFYLSVPYYLHSLPGTPLNPYTFALYSGPGGHLYGWHPDLGVMTLAVERMGL